MSEVLSRQEAVQLIEQAQAGDENAREELVRRNLALVKSIVRKFLGRGVEFDDLFQIGCMGLVKAIRNFDDAYGVQFSTYAVPMISGEIKRFLRDDGMVKVSRSLKETAARAAAAAEAISRRMGREATILEIAEAIDATPEDIVFAQEASRSCVSLHEPIFEEDGTMLIDRIGQQEHDDPEGMIDHILLKELIGKLEPKERQVIVMRYFQDQTQSEIARRLGVSQVQISRLESRILQKLRETAR